jgi:hypothetical protein
MAAPLGQEYRKFPQHFTVAPPGELLGNDFLQANTRNAGLYSHKYKLIHQS